MNKAAIPLMPPYYAKYLPLVPEDNLLDAMYASLNQIKQLDLDKIKSIGHNVYAPGKWTVHELLQHIIDTERIFNYRALAFARGEVANLPPMDENAYSANSGASQRSIDDIVSEMITVRNASISLFKSFTPEMLQKIGTANNTENSVLALGFFLVGHATHHLNVMRERYF